MTENINTQPLGKQEKLIIEQIKHLLEKDDIVVFSNEEIKVIRNMISVYQTLIAFGKLGSLMKNLIVGFAACLGAYYAIQTWGSNVVKHLVGL